jgi:hypothetical protein
MRTVTVPKACVERGVAAKSDETLIPSEKVLGADWAV